MLKLVVLLSFVACALGAAIPEGMVPQLDGRIVSGSETTIGNHPYQISLQLFREHRCGGTIYNEKVIITAAHCVINVAPSNLMVRAGTTTESSGGTYVGVESYKCHENYNAKFRMDDIAVVRLASSLSFSSDIRSIGLLSNHPNAGDTLVVTGWGATSDGGSFASTLQMAYVNYITPQECASSSYGYGDQIKYGMICARAPEKDACQGDSGGPLVYIGGLVGITSWGLGCGDPRYPGVYTSIPIHRSWIEYNA